MGDPYHKYDDAPVGRASVARPSYSGYLTSEAPSFPSHQPLGSIDMRGGASDFPQREINPIRPGQYGLDDSAGIGVHPEPGMSGITAGASVTGYSTPRQELNLIAPRRDSSLGLSPTIPDMVKEMPNSLRIVNGSPSIKGESNILFVDGLPTDCTRREVGHLFRPFIGYREIKVVHKEPRHSGDRARVLCFVEFVDSKCALTAMQALQGYKFDDKKVDSPVIRIRFAHFPFRPSDDGEQQTGIPRLV